MLSSSGSLGVFFSNGLVGSLTVLALAIFIWPFISQAMSRLKSSA
jgi:putative tricarboxylic transport membrane protein